MSLADELYAWAGELPRSRWYTTRYRDFEEMVRTRSPEPLARLKARIEASWQRYYAQPLACEERTAETVAGHRLLVEGLAGWLKAIELCEQGAPESQVLTVAEAANRLLMAVQHQAERLARFKKKP